MGRVNVIGIMTNITPEQMEVVTNLCAKLDIKPAQLVRMALAVYCEANGETWPPAHIAPGGNRRKREKLVT